MRFRIVGALPLVDYGKGRRLAPEVSFGGNGATPGPGQERVFNNDRFELAIRLCSQSRRQHRRCSSCTGWLRGYCGRNYI
jgi:hypothetical protein